MSNNNLQDSGVKKLQNGLKDTNCTLNKLSLSDCILQDPNCQLKTLRFLSPAANEACQYVSGIVGKNPLLLRDLNLGECELGDTRVNQITALLQDKHCKLNTLILYRCSITEKQCLILISALKLNPSYLRELDISENELKNTGVSNLCDVLKDSHCKLERL
ncbi:ribonuclease inhibitor-like, partial [Carassius auratus]|uniref:Ribonuclease inhibitor-like n=1 Tax=Carassius auratus TaxID=7957 RepID=A0A6P6NLI6_CARAU